MVKQYEIFPSLAPSPQSYPIFCSSQTGRHGTYLWVVKDLNKVLIGIGATL